MVWDQYWDQAAASALGNPCGAGISWLMSTGLRIRYSLSANAVRVISGVRNAQRLCSGQSFGACPRTSVFGQP